MTSPIADILAEIGAAHDAGRIDQPTAVSRIQAVMDVTDVGADGILRNQLAKRATRPTTAPNVLARASAVISANRYVGDTLAAVLAAEGVLTGGNPRMPVREGIRVVLVAHGHHTPDQAEEVARRLAELNLLANEG